MPADNEGLDINISAPFEQLATKLLDVWVRVRESMSQENRDAWDAEGLKLYRISIGYVVKKIEETQKP